MTACRAAGLCGAVKTGRTTLGIVGGSKSNDGRAAPVEMSRGFSAGPLMANTAIAVYAGQ